MVGALKASKLTDLFIGTDLFSISIGSSYKDQQQSAICNNSCVIKCYKIDRRDKRSANTGIKLLVLTVMNLEEATELM